MLFATISLHPALQTFALAGLAVAATQVTITTRLCLERLARFRKRSPQTALRLLDEQAAEQVKRIVQDNIRSGRYLRLCQKRRPKPPLTRIEYIDQVVEYWVAESDRVHRLQAGDPEEWQRLGASLYTAAHQVLNRLDPTHSAANAAEDYAQRACIKVFNSPYPFDVAFDAWVRTILRNLILEQYRSKDALDHSHTSLDAPVGDSGTSVEPADTAAGISDEAVQAILDTLSDRSRLARALRSLRSPIQRAVIELAYFGELSDKQIARKLDKTVSNIQTLRHRALENLRKFLKPDGDVSDE